MQQILNGWLADDVKYLVKPGFHIVVSDGDVPASMGTWWRRIGDVIKSSTDFNFSHLDWDIGGTYDGDVGDITKKRSHIIVSVPVASLFHWLGRVPVTYDDMETRLNGARNCCWL